MIITAETKLDIEKSFKVEAGPGAGKTRFLVNHIEHVLHESKRLSSTRKVACITFSNVAVETIRKRLGKSASTKTEILTIHSFLYNNIIKPYKAFIPKKYSVCYNKIDGHNEPTANGRYVLEWLRENEFDALKHPNTVRQLSNLPEYQSALRNWLLSAKAILKSDEVEWSLNDKAAVEYSNSGRVGITKNNLNILRQKFIDYKKLYWKEGKLDHEDVLFFSSILIKEYPFILEVLRAKYPYIFIDEFQDTNPIQSFIISEIRKKESVIGVIGDKAQAIYGFQGAKVELFNNFKIQKELLYTITENQRSDRTLVRFLNLIRNDLSQNPCKEFQDAMIALYVGDRNTSFEEAKKICGKERLVSLSRDNITSNAMKNKVENNNNDRKLLKKLDEMDGNRERRRYVNAYIHAIELARNQKYKDAIDNIEWIYKKEKDAKKIAFKMLMIYLKEYENYTNLTLMDFYNVIIKNEKVCSLSKFRTGKANTFYRDTKYIDAAICVNITEDTSDHITIHKAKGEEFENVFIVGNKEFLSFLLNPDILKNEEHRIYYVALSRAKKRLFMHLDTLDESEEDILKNKFSLLIQRI